VLNAPPRRRIEAVIIAVHSRGRPDASREKNRFRKKWREMIPIPFRIEGKYIFSRRSGGRLSSV